MFAFERNTRQTSLSILAVAKKDTEKRKPLKSRVCDGGAVSSYRADEQLSSRREGFQIKEGSQGKHAQPLSSIRKKRRLKEGKEKVMLFLGNSGNQSSWRFSRWKLSKQLPPGRGF